MSKNGSIRKSIRITKEMDNRIKNLIGKTYMKDSEVMRRALDIGLNKMKNER